jgi:hypothetical protein
MAHCPVAPLQQSVLRGKQREGSVKVALYFYNTPVNRCWFALPRWISCDPSQRPARREKNRSNILQAFAFSYLLSTWGPQQKQSEIVPISNPPRLHRLLRYTKTN